MTTRLLHPAFRAADAYAAPRDALRERRTSTRVSIGAAGQGLRVGCLPLMRTIDGSLRQAVRVDADGGAVDRPVQVALRLGDHVLDGADLSSGTHVDLWVPAVDGATIAELVVDGQGRGEVEITPQRHWTVHLVHHSHLDIGYTDPQGVVLRNHLEYLDAALQLCAATDGREDDARFRWCVESVHPVMRWLDARSPQAVKQFIERVHEGRIELTALPFQLHTEACSEEEFRRLLRFAVELRERYGVTIDTAMHTDVCGAVAGVVDALAEAGIRYLTAAHNWAGRSVPYLTGGTNLSRPFWWRSPSGRRLLVWFTDTAHGMAYMEGNIVGFADGYEIVEELLPAYLDGLAHRYAPYGAEIFGWNGPMEEAAEQRAPYPYDLLHLRVQGAHADNACPSSCPSEVVARWNATYTWPRLRLSTNHAFFTEMERRFGDEVDEFTGDWTDWWADGMASGARPLGWVRRAQSVLRTAETVHALADARSGDFCSPTSSFDETYDEVALFDEHTWGAANPWHDEEVGFNSGQKQWTWKQGLAVNSLEHAEDLLHAGVRRLAMTFSNATPSPPVVQVINPGSGRRSDLVTVFVPASIVPLSRNVALVDTRTAQLVSSETEVVRPEDYPTRPPGRRIRLVAEEVPAVGSARFDIVDEPTRPVTPLERSASAICLGTGDYQVQVDTDRGVIASIRYRPADRELVHADALAGMNECILDSYATAPYVNHLSGKLAAKDKELLAERTIAGPASVIEAKRTPVCDRVVLERRAHRTRGLRTTIEVPHTVARVNIVNRLIKEPTAAKESLYFAFPLATSGRPVWELSGAVGGTDIPAVPGSAEHLQFLRHWVVFEEDDLTIAWATLEAALVHFGDIPLPYAPFPPTLQPERPEPGTIYSWALNNIWDTNFPPQQAGEMAFHYAIAATSDTPGRALGVQTAAGLTDPMVALLAQGGERETQGPAVDHPLVRVSSIGRSRDGEALVVRLRSLAPQSTAVPLHLGFLQPSRVLVGNGLERETVEKPVQDGTVEITVPAEGMCSVRLEMRGVR